MTFLFVDIPSCKEENVVFANHQEFSRIYMGGMSFGENCRVSVIISHCHQERNESLCIDTESNPIIEFESVNMFYGNNVTVTLDNDCDYCEENHFYIPDMNLTG